MRLEKLSGYQKRVRPLRKCSFSTHLAALEGYRWSAPAYSFLHSTKNDPSPPLLWSSGLKATLCLTQALNFDFIREFALVVEIS